MYYPDLCYYYVYKWGKRVGENHYLPPMQPITYKKIIQLFVFGQMGIGLHTVTLINIHYCKFFARFYFI